MNYEVTIIIIIAITIKVITVISSEPVEETHHQLHSAASEV